MFINFVFYGLNVFITAFIIIISKLVSRHVTLQKPLIT